MRDVLINQLSELKVYAYKYEGYVSRIESIYSYYRLNMDLLNEEIRTPLLYRPNPVYTKVKDEVPARYEAGAKAVNSLVADGCIIEGTVENSVLFRGVRVGKGAVVKDCILMQSVEVQDGAQLSHVISDKNAFIKRDRRIVGQESYPVVIEKNAVTKKRKGEERMDSGGQGVLSPCRFSACGRHSGNRLERPGDA